MAHTTLAALASALLVAFVHLPGASAAVVCKDGGPACIQAALAQCSDVTLGASVTSAIKTSAATCAKAPTIFGNGYKLGSLNFGSAVNLLNVKIVGEVRFEARTDVWWEHVDVTGYVLGRVLGPRRVRWDYVSVTSSPQNCVEMEGLPDEKGALPFYELGRNTWETQNYGPCEGHGIYLKNYDGGAIENVTVNTARRGGIALDAATRPWVSSKFFLSRVKVIFAGGFGVYARDTNIEVESAYAGAWVPETCAGHRGLSVDSHEEGLLVYFTQAPPVAPPPTGADLMPYAGAGDGLLFRGGSHTLRNTKIRGSMGLGGIFDEAYVEANGVCVESNLRGGFFTLRDPLLINDGDATPEIDESIFDDNRAYAIQAVETMLAISDATVTNTRTATDYGPFGDGIDVVDGDLLVHDVVASGNARAGVLVVATEGYILDSALTGGRFGLVEQHGSSITRSGTVLSGSENDHLVDGDLPVPDKASEIP